MDLNSIKCKCGKIFSKQDFHQHFQKCQDFKNNFKHFDQEFGELLKRYSEPKDNLFIIKFLLSQYIIVLDKKIQNYLTQLSSSGINKVSGSNNTNFSGNSKNTFNNSNNNTFNNSNNYGIRPAQNNHLIKKIMNHLFKKMNQ